MVQIIDSRYLINSRDRTVDSTSSTNFTTFFQQPLFSPGNEHKYRLALTQITFPLTYFTVNTTNDRMLITETHAGVSTQFNIQLTHGNLTPTQVLTNIMNSLNTSSPNGFTYSIVLSTTSGLNTFSFTSGSASDTVAFNSSSTYFTSDDMLGLDPNNDLIVPEGTNVNSPIIVNFSGLADYTVVVNIVNLSSDSTFSSQTGNVANTIAHVPIIGGLPFNVYTYTSPIIGFDSMAYAMSLGNRLQVQLTDTRGLPISLNGKDVQLTLIVYHEE